ncbi:MAG: hypothetical protein U9Q33_06940 [Campylobacterota bacterium]|nr:hypothetical protein [Campylobacterota bacterium]
MFEKNINSDLKTKVTNDRVNAIKQLNSTLQQQVDYLYTVQLVTFYQDQIEQIKDKFNTLPKTIKDESFIYPTGKYLTLKYSSARLAKELNSKLNLAIEAGFESAFISKMSKEKYNRITNQSIRYDKKVQKNEELSTDEGTPLWCIQQQSIPMIKLDNYEYTRALTDAHKYKNQNRTLKSIETYEKLFAHDHTNSAIVNNIFYLYGKTNNWPKANEKLCLLKKKDKAIYSYAIGALEINNPMIEEELASSLQYDRSGYVHLALAVYFERNEEYKKSHQFYKSAYNRNRYDLYLAFAYARSCEIESQYKKAVFIYQLISNSNDKRYKNLITQAYNRYNQLRKINTLKKR